MHIYQIGDTVADKAIKEISDMPGMATTKLSNAIRMSRNSKIT